MAELQDFSSDSKQQTKAAICHPAVATIHRCLCQGRVRIIHGNLAVESTRLGSSASFFQSTRVQRVQWCNYFGNTQIYKGTSASKVFDVFFIKFLPCSNIPCCWHVSLKSSKWRSRSQQLQQLSTFKSPSYALVHSMFLQAPCAAGGPGDGAARAQPHLAPGRFWRFAKNVSKRGERTFLPMFFSVTIWKL